jgi:hypothetical protein
VLELNQYLEAFPNKREWTYSIDVGEGVLSLAVLSQDARGNLVHLADQLEHRVIRELAEGKLALRNVTRIGLTEDGVAVAGNNLARVQSGPKIVLNGLITEVIANGCLHLGEPVEHFLVGPVEAKDVS